MGKKITRKAALKTIENSMGNATVFVFVKQHMINLINKIFDDLEK